MGRPVFAGPMLLLLLMLLLDAEDVWRERGWLVGG